MNPVDEIIDEGKLTLERLLLNIRMEEKITVINKENDLAANGTEEEIRNNKPQWLDMLVWNIYCDDGKLKIEISE